MSKVLIIEDEVSIAELEKDYLELSGFDVEIESDGARGLEKALASDFDMYILDLMLPGMDGYQVCRELRQRSSVPIIILSAKGEVFDKVLGLELGADDYMIKPFDSNELVARVKAVLRRTVMTQAVTTAAPVSIAEVTDHQGEFVEYDGLLINMTNYTVTLDGESVEMPPKELELLYFLAKRPNQVFTRDQLLDRLWDYEYAGDSRTVDVHIKRLREKLNENHNWSISTVWGKGYKFEVK